ncbi:hypothetical protein DLE60_24690 [Micromonospora globispora]|uniref:Zinc ABC transporter substrate-binding protein n=1 Tax=Micromonospora globispora TaxID=1450148 RepID=A0A317KGG3_9ACTN|nr:hypothetical protein DLJ46_04985 [Micromonospora globispora]PWU57367.1 hypothetical protein DLE60_24690 [Micromonospora globispora]RQX00653.1 hypothetical protein DKL51_06575 [Micromonospora globispora]
MRTLGVALAVAALGAVTGCGASGTSGASQPSATGGIVPVVATTPEVADFVRNVGGDAVSVTQIIKPNVDPHDYEPTPPDIQAIGKARFPAASPHPSSASTSTSAARSPGCSWPPRWPRSPAPEARKPPPRPESSSPPASPSASHWSPPRTASAATCRPSWSAPSSPSARRI